MEDPAATEDPETKIYNLIKATDNDFVFILINPYEIDIFVNNCIRINRIFFHYYDYNTYYSYSNIIKYYKNKYNTDIYLLGGGTYDTRFIDNNDNENIHVENTFNCLKYLSKYKDEIIVKNNDESENSKFINLLKKNYKNSLFYCYNNTGIIGIEGHVRFYDKFYSYLDSIDTIYIINNFEGYSNDFYYGLLKSKYNNKIKFLKINVCKLFYTNPELIAYYRSRTDFNNHNYLDTYYNFKQTFTQINDNIIIGNDSYRYIKYLMKKDINSNWFPADVTYIINVSTDIIQPEKIPYDNIIYEHYPISESETDNNITKAILLEAVDRLHELIQNNNKVFIHCSIGMNRSPAVVLLYFIKYCNMTLYEAYKYIATKRHIFTSFDLFDIIYNETIELYNSKSCKKSHNNIMSLLCGSLYYNKNIISPLKLRTNYAYNFSDPNAYMFSLYDTIYIENLISDEYK